MVALITIKKSDGSSEKITLDEFKRRPAFASLRRGKPASVKPAVSTSVPPKSEDAKSLLEDELPEKRDDAPTKSADKKKETEEVFKKLNFNFLTPDAANRLRGLIQLRLKDLRSDDEVKEWLLMPAKELGVELRGEQAEKVLKLCREAALDGGKSGPAKPLKVPLGTPRPLMKEAPEPMQKYREPPMPATGSPYNSFVHRPEPTKEIKSINQLSKMQSKIGPGGMEAPRKKDETARPVMRDIRPARPMEMGPVDEIKYFSLTDFRRLSSNPAEAASRLKQKFFNLRDESYILYLDALDAWRVCPLFAEYNGRLDEALNAGKKLAEVLTDKNNIQMNEISAIIEMEKELT